MALEVLAESEIQEEGIKGKEEYETRSQTVIIDRGTCSWTQQAFETIKTLTKTIKQSLAKS